MRRIVKIRKAGGSAAITLPLVALELLNLEVGDYVLLTVYDDGTIYIEKA